MPPPLHFHELLAPNDERDRVHIPSPPPSPPSSPPPSPPSFSPTSLPFPINTPSPWQSRTIQLPDVDEQPVIRYASRQRDGLKRQHSDKNNAAAHLGVAGVAPSSAGGLHLSPRSRRVSFGDVSIHYLHNEGDDTSATTTAAAAAAATMPPTSPQPSLPICPQAVATFEVSHSQKAGEEQAAAADTTTKHFPARCRWFSCCR
jgi:hypothetical protein